MQIHEIIRTRRTALGLTQEQLAGKLGVSAPAVNKWEREFPKVKDTIYPNPRLHDFNLVTEY